MFSGKGFWFLLFFVGDLVVGSFDFGLFGGFGGVLNFLKRFFMVETVKILIGSFRFGKFAVEFVFGCGMDEFGLFFEFGFDWLCFLLLFGFRGWEKGG